MGVSGPKYTNVPNQSGFENESAATSSAVPIPVVPVATAMDASGLENPSSSMLPTALKVDDSSATTLSRRNSKNGNEETITTEDGITITWEKGELQPPAYRDKWFAVAFVSHLVFVTVASVTLGPKFWNDAVKELEDSKGDDYDGDVDNDESDAMYNPESESSTASDDDFSGPPKEFWFAVIAIAMAAAPALSFGALTLMSRNAIGLIKGSLWFSIILCGISAVLLLAVAPPVGFIYGIFTVCLIWYQRAVQSRIPYAASNLKCAITVLKTNLGLGLVVLGSMAGLLAYCLSWSFAIAGTMQLDIMKDTTSGSSNSGYGQTNYGSSGDPSSSSSDLSALGSVVGFLFLLCFYWTHQVFQNVTRATVSGVVGTWWFDPSEASSFCSAAVSSSLLRSTTYSLGSICFGSLIVAIIHMIRNSLRRAQNDRNGGGLLRCIAMCLLAYLERLVEYFNKWAYVYVGLYGYGYVDAGRKVIDLFKKRGWMTIIADNLVNRLLGIVSLTIGLLTGVCSLFAAFLVEEFESKQGWAGVGFVVGFFIGLILSGVFMGLLSSAVDAIIVCYAEAPKELEETHPAVAQEMATTWTEAWGSNMNGPVIVGLGGGPGIV
eukprot:CAMPEP_0183710522 /NCGR_PEP_ID=MMETSP0737-20130205/6229_1 /TAXON_ID=385413 /ORGANISM="Thalassiosira miniscula, Strain CCMP1093" /LENGTH=604 /DNA_ID=CAMNT_0025938813 /DNA_START=38 /DNA_END=1852 /DNA_ORIENTATION=-